MSPANHLHGVARIVEETDLGPTQRGLEVRHGSREGLISKVVFLYDRETVLSQGCGDGASVLGSLREPAYGLIGPVSHDQGHLATFKDPWALGGMQVTGLCGVEPDGMNRQQEKGQEAQEGELQAHASFPAGDR